MRIGLVGSSSMLARIFAQHAAPEAFLIKIGRGKECDICWDITSGKIPDDLPELDCIVNCIASFGGDEIEQSFENYKVNALGCLHLIQFAKKCGASHILHLSSISAAFRELPELWNSYGLSKGQGEEILFYHARAQGICTTILRPTQIIDDHGLSMKHQKLFFYLLRSAREGKDFGLSGTQDTSRNYIHTDDVSRVMLAMVKDPIDGIFTYGSRQNWCAKDIFERACQHLHTQARFFLRQGGLQVPSYPCPDSRSTYTTFKVEPLVDMVEMIKRALIHMKDLP